uniref:Neugrin n=1 Tax=Cercocebus atys TaxID=9531 RepID=A0A2K5NJX1_CERAT
HAVTLSLLLGRCPIGWEPGSSNIHSASMHGFCPGTLKRQKKAIRFQKIQRQMEAPAVEQIRYLYEEFPESWPVPRLAEGFDVSTDVIRRVLKGKFVPTLEQTLKQDQKVLKKAGLAYSLQQLPGSGNMSKPLPAGHSVSGSLLMPRHEASSKDPNHSTALKKVIESDPHRTNTPRRWKGRNKEIQDLEEWVCHQRELQKFSSDAGSTRRTGDAALPSEQKLEELEAEEPGNFSSQVAQRGREFFDSNGNFLYGI